MQWCRTPVVSLLALCATLCPALIAQPDDIPQHERKAHEYLRDRQPELALKEFAIVASAQPANLDAQANLGVLLYFAGDVPQAAPHLKAALALDPKQSRLQALLGFCERRNGELSAARADLQAALPGLTEDKVRKQAGLELIELETSAGDLSAASATVTSLRASLPTDPEVLYAAYRIFTDLANESMLDLSLADPDSAQMHQVMAHELLKARDNSAAIANLRQAIVLDPHLPGAHFELAEILASSSAPALKAEALKQFELALSDNPRDDKALVRLGDLAADNAEHDAAIARYRQALALQPENADASIGLAHELAETNSVAAALPLLLTVIKSDPSNLLAHFRLSAVYRRLHRTEDAKREVDEYERLKAAKEKLRGVYDALHMNAHQSNDIKN